MPYNTRRKSLSLPSLGIHVPVTNAERAAAAAAAATAAAAAAAAAAAEGRPSMPKHARSHSATTAMAPPSPPRSRPTPPSDAERMLSPKNKVKRSISDVAADRGTNAKRQQTDAARTAVSAKERGPTPPPSPGASSRAFSVEMMDAEETFLAPRSIDLKSINDDIVEAVVRRLQAEGNRPHLVKELSTVLIPQLRIVQQSANPCAIISSRLSSFLKRSCWNAASPCPLAKELETVHPRRTYFYLTTCPHAPLPSPTSVKMPTIPLSASRAIITPSLSSGSGSVSLDDDMDSRRRELSPSPEVDLSSPVFDDVLFQVDDEGNCIDDAALTVPGTPIGVAPPRRATIPFGVGSTMDARRHGGARGGSPPLEKDEREFTQTANGLLGMRRTLSGPVSTQEPLVTVKTEAEAAALANGAEDAVMGDVETMQARETKEQPSEGLFGDTIKSPPTTALLAPPAGLSSPTVLPLATPLLSAMAGFAASPMLKPSLSLHTGAMKKGGLDGMMSMETSWASLDDPLSEWDRSPERIDLEELDCWLDEF